MGRKKKERRKGSRFSMSQKGWGDEKKSEIQESNIIHQKINIVSCERSEEQETPPFMLFSPFFFLQTKREITKYSR